MSSRTSSRIVVLSALLLLVGGMTGPVCTAWLGQARAQAQQPAQLAAPDARSDERAAIQAAWKSFVNAFESRDAKALAAHWSTGGEFQPVEGTRVQGRAALEKEFTALFARTPELKAEVKSNGLRFLSSESAIDEGTVAVRRGRLEPALNVNFSAFFVRDGGHWYLAQLNESPGDSETVADLGWLVGEWKSAAKDGAEIRTVYSWHSNKKFLQSQFTIKEKAHTFSGTQVIGMDPRTGEIHSWSFEADGGIGEADWHRDGDHWVLDAGGTTADGRALTETNVLRRVNEDTITWQSINRALEDSELADLPPVKVTRVKAGN